MYYTEKIKISANSFEKNMEKITEISSFKKNWNGNLAKPFSKKVIRNVIDIIVALQYQPEIFPTAADSIQLEYEGSNHSYLGIEINESGVATVFRVNQDGREDRFDIYADSNEINKLVKEFYEYSMLPGAQKN